VGKEGFREIIINKTRDVIAKTPETVKGAAATLTAVSIVNGSQTGMVVFGGISVVSEALVLANRELSAKNRRN